MRDRHERAHGAAARPRRARARRRRSCTESIIGTRFTGRLVEETRRRPAGVVPEITGRAWITGHGPVPARPRRPVPARVPALTADGRRPRRRRRHLRRGGALRAAGPRGRVLLLDRGEVAVGHDRARRGQRAGRRQAAGPRARARARGPRAVARARRALPGGGQAARKGSLVLFEDDGAAAFAAGLGADARSSTTRARSSRRWRRAAAGRATSRATCRSTRAPRRRRWRPRSRVRTGAEVVRAERRRRRAGRRRAARPPTPSWSPPARGRRRWSRARRVGRARASSSRSARRPASSPQVLRGRLPGRCAGVAQRDRGGADGRGLRRLEPRRRRLRRHRRRRGDRALLARARRLDARPRRPAGHAHVVRPAPVPAEGGPVHRPPAVGRVGVHRPRGRRRRPRPRHCSSAGHAPRAASADVPARRRPTYAARAS